MGLWLALVLIPAALTALFWWMDRIGGTPLPHVPVEDIPDEPCWTEEVRGEDGLSYGRKGCYRSQIDDMEVRLARGEMGERVAD